MHGNVAYNKWYEPSIVQDNRHIHVSTRLNHDENLSNKNMNFYKIGSWSYMYMYMRDISK